MVKQQEVEVLRMSLWVLLFRLLLVEFIFILSSLSFKYLSDIFSSTSESFGIWLESNLLWILVFHFIEILSLVFITLSWGGVLYSVSSRNITTRTGVFSIQENTYNTHNIESVKVKQSFWGILFHYGTVILYAPTLNETIHISRVGNPAKVAETIKEFLKDSNPKIIPRKN